MKKRTPYAGLPDRQFWKKEPGISDRSRFDPVGPVPFKISRTDSIVTAGSCFAQHVARYLRDAGYNYLVTEKAHPVFMPELAREFQYGSFSARYGNLYTARQLKQLLLRAHGEFEPLVTCWTKGESGLVVDPFRPQIQPEGFTSEAELMADRRVHFTAVREAVARMDVFVFTLGLTEAWIDKRDGAVFPIAPGLAGGVYDTDLVGFQNFSLAETVQDIEFSLNFIRKINPDVKIILTVSPVPLNATYENRHVFVSTTWSKSVLRLAAEEMIGRFENSFYFPSYEVITAPHVRGMYFGPDCREVTEEGVSHVMQLFFRHLTDASATTSALIRAENAERELVNDHLAQMNRAIEVLCDEEAITND